VLFRVATRLDLPGYLLLAPTIREKPQDTHAFNWKISKRTFEAIQDSPNADLVVGIDEGSVVAACVLVMVPGFAYNGQPWAMVEHVVVHPDLRGQGVGRELMEWVEKLAEKRGAYKVQCIANEDAGGFYEALGWDKQGLLGFRKYL